MASAAAGGSNPAEQCLTLDWVFGLNRDFKGVVHNLSDGNRKAIFYFVAHTAIIYDVTSHTQKLLQGHRNPIIASCVSANRRFVVTADAGDDCTIIVWDTYSCVPVKFINASNYGGVLACDISNDAMYLVTLSKQTPQTIALWAWTSDNADVPELTAEVTAKDEQNCVKFSPDDPKVVVTNGAKRVIFWSWSEGSWKFYAPPISAKDVKQSIGNFTQSIFVPGTGLACTATVDGDVLLWSSVLSDKVTKQTDKTLSKVVRVHNGGVTFLGAIGDYIVTGGVEGFVRFLDRQLRIVAWFEELNGGPIISVSFDKPQGTQGLMANNPNASASSLALNKTAAADGAPAFTGDDFSSPDFVVSTANALVINVSASSFTSGDPESQRGTLIIQGQDEPIMAVAAHPTLPRIAIGGFSGTVHLWEYSTRSVIMLSIFRNQLVQCLAFDPKGMHLGVGFTNGAVSIIDANSCKEMQEFPAKSSDCITAIAFSHDSQLFATADADGCVGLYRFTHRAQDLRKQIEWVYIGRHRTHRAAITGLQFGVVPYGDTPRLMSLGEDKRLVEYNLLDSDIESGLRMRCVHKVTQGAVPTGLLWTTEQLLDDKSMPMARDSKAAMCADVLLIPTNEYKLKLHATDMSRQCIKTLLSPTFGGPLNNILVVPAQPGAVNRCLVYSTHEKVVGLIKLPLDGNPRSAMGLLAHPLEISSMAVSFDGKYLFTAGGRDCSVMTWKISADDLVIDGGKSRVDHFIDVIEGGSKGAFMKEIIDYFYYAQIRAQGEETTAKRKIVGQIPFGQVPNLMRALGYYPSDKEIQHMTFEVDTRFGGKPEVSVDDICIDFETFIRLYVNHRPVFGINKRNIEAAFAAVGADPVTGIVDKQELFTMLQNHGEKLQAGDIDSCLQALLGDDVTLDLLEDKLTAKAFAENLLGFEDYEDGGADNNAGDAAAAEAQVDL